MLTELILANIITDKIWGCLDVLVMCDSFGLEKIPELAIIFLWELISFPGNLEKNKAYIQV